MSDLSFAHVGPHSIETLTITIPNVGPWTAEVAFIEAPALTGRVVIQVGTERLTGTIAPSEDGTFGLKRQSMIVAGAGAWGATLTPKHYHNDAGCKAQLIAADAARESGESLGAFVPSTERLAVDYVRAAGPASLALQAAAGGAPWWVDYAGITRVGPRPSSATDSGAYEVLAFNPHTRRGTLAINTLGAVGIGSIITERLDQPQTIRELTITIGAEGLRARFWSGASAEPAHSELAQILTDIVAAQLGRRLLGKYQYRVVSMHTDGRVNVQAVRRAAGLPDAQTIRMLPGVPGAHAELTPGAIVALEFLEGDPTQPIITGFVGLNGSGFTPTLLTLGGPEGPRAARVGDEVQCGGPGSTITIGPATVPPAPPAPVMLGVAYPVSYGSSPVVPIPDKLTGTITKGSSIVHIAGESV
jgi:uncharacterized Zn-binding protein involved in type VI secretion